MIFVFVVSFVENIIPINLIKYFFKNSIIDYEGY